MHLHTPMHFKELMLTEGLHCIIQMRKSVTPKTIDIYYHNHSRGKTQTDQTSHRGQIKRRLFKGRRAIYYKIRSSTASAGRIWAKLTRWPKEELVGGKNRVHTATCATAVAP